MNSGYHFAMPPLSKTNKILLISMLTLFILDTLFSKAGVGNLSAIFGLSYQRFFSFHFHQILTYSLIPTQLIELLFDSLIIWFMGSELEYYWGNKRYVLNLLVWSVGAGTFFLLISGATGNVSLLTGPQTLVYGMLVSYATIFPDRQLYLYFFPVKAKIFCLVMIGIQLYLGIFSGMVGAFAGLSAMGLGWLSVRFSFLQIMQGTQSRPKSKNKPGLKIVKGEKDEKEPPKYWH